MVPVQGCPVAGLIALVMVTVSADGFTVTLTFPIELRPVDELVAVTVNDKVRGAVLGGTVGAVILSRKAKFQVLCERRDSNPHGFTRQILSSQ